MAPEVTDWLAEPAQRRWHLHFTPTASSWLNLVQRWFALLTDKRLRRGVFGSVKELTAAIRLWAKHWNADPQPFIWTKAADEIIEKVRRGRGRTPPGQIRDGSLGGILVIGILPPLLMDRLRKPGWKVAGSAPTPEL